MKISELPTPYQQLAKYRRSWLSKSGPADFVSIAFDWEKSPEKCNFWYNVHNAGNIQDLPAIPPESYPDLNEIAKVDREVYEWLQEQKDIQTGGELVGTLDNLQTFKMALECVRDAENPESLFDDLELVYNIAAIIATKGDITMKQLLSLQDASDEARRRL